MSASQHIEVGPQQALRAGGAGVSKASSRLRHVLILLVVLVVFGVPAAITGWVSYRVIQRGHLSETGTNMMRISRALRTYQLEIGNYPASEPVAVETVFPIIGGKADEPLVGTDAWGRPITYQSSGDHFLLISRSRNGKPDLSDHGGKQPGFDVDVVMFDAKFWQWSSGV